MFSPSDQDILRALIAERGSAVIPTSNVSQLVTQSNPKVIQGMQGLPLPSSGGIGYSAQTPNYKIDPRGNRAGDMMIDAASTYGDLSGQFYDGMSKPIRQAKAGAGRMIGRGGRKMAGKAGAALGGLPGMGKLGAAAKVLGPGLAAAGGALAVGDVLFGQDSGANKAMDATAMTIGGLLGSVGGPLGTAAGVGLGKMASDATQFVFGGGKSAEERRMEEALAMLQGGRI